jgi:hypothetical protein
MAAALIPSVGKCVLASMAVTLAEPSGLWGTMEEGALDEFIVVLSDCVTAITVSS